jgi:hypothetical protein
MSFLIGLISGLVAAALTWSLTGVLVVNLPALTARWLSISLAVIALAVAFLAGSAAYSRARRSREHLTLFSSVAFAVAGGVIGAAFAVGMTAGYLHTFATPTTSPLDLVLTVLSYPIFGLLGLSLGAITGSIAGLFASGALRVLAPTPR